MEFARNKIFGIDGSIKWVYTLKPVEGEPARPSFKIEASIQGVVLIGELKLSKYADLNPMAKAIGDAWKDHRALMPDLRASLAGH